MAVTIANSTTAGINYGRWSAINNLTQLTVSAWIRPFSDASGTFGRIVSKENGWLVRSVGLGGGFARMETGMMFGSTNTLVYSTTSTPAGTSAPWSHLAATWDGSGSAPTAFGIWINATPSTLVASTLGSGQRPDDSAVNFWIGNLNGTARPFDGQIAEVGIWNALLTPAEIAALSRGFSPSHIRPTAMRFHAPLIRDFRPLQQNATIASSGVTVAPHPRIIL